MMVWAFWHVLTGVFTQLTLHMYIILSSLSHDYSFKKLVGWHMFVICVPLSPPSLSFLNLTLDQCDSTEQLVQFLHCFRLIHKGETQGLQGVALRELFKALLCLRWNSTSHPLIGRCYCTVCQLQCALHWCKSLSKSARDPPCFKIPCLHL